MTSQIPHFIDGRRSNLASTRTADVFNPSTGQVQGKVLLASRADVDTAVASAVEAQKEALADLGEKRKKNPMGSSIWRVSRTVWRIWRARMRCLRSNLGMRAVLRRS